MSSDGEALIAQMVSTFIERRRAGLRPSLQELAEAAGRPLLDQRLRSEALIAIARAAREQTQTFVYGSSQCGDRFDELDLDATTLPEIAGYDIVDVVGRGGMGVVYEAYQQSTGRRVAVKFLLEADTARESARRRFEREADLVARLNHPGIVSILDSGVHRGTYFYVMEYVEGRPLDEACPPGNSEPRQALSLLAAICDAVDYAHQRGVLHRDLKPTNILVHASAPKVLDFGLAKAIDPTAGTGAARRTLSRPGQFVGTLAYVAPEQARADYDQLSVRSDVYSLGAIAYELLTGAPPISVEGGLRDALNRIAEAEPRRPSSLRADLDRDIDAIVLRAIEKNPARRYASAAELAADIRRYLRGEPIVARPIGLGERIWRRMRRDKRVSGAIALGVLAVIATYAFGQYRVWAQRDAGTRLNQSIDDLLRQATALDDEPLSQATRERLAQWDAEIDAYRNVPDLEAVLRESLGRTAYAYGDYRRALDNLKAAWGIRKYNPRSRGDQSLSLASLDHAIALAEFKLNRDESAETRLRDDVLPVLARAANPAEPSAARSPALAAAWCDLGRVLTSRDRLAEADACFQRAIDMHAEVGNPLGEADARTYYGYCLDRTGRPMQGIEQLQKALDAYRRSDPDRDSARIAFALVNLSNCQRRASQAAAAKASATAALEMYQRLYPAGHPQIVVCMNHLMLAERDLGRYDESLRLAEETLRLRIAAYPDTPDHDNIAVSRLNLGQALMETAQFDRAEREMLAARAMFERKPDAARNHRLAATLHSLAELYRRTDRRGDALHLCDEALRIRRDIFGPRHIDVAASHFLRGRLLLDDGDPTNAEPDLVQAVSIMTEAGTADTFRLALYRYFLGECRFRLERIDEAELDLPDGMRGIHALRPHWTDPTPIEACKRVVELYERKDNPELAAMYRKLLPPDGAADDHEGHDHP